MSVRAILQKNEKKESILYALVWFYFEDPWIVEKSNVKIASLKVFYNFRKKNIIFQNFRVTIFKVGVSLRLEERLEDIIE